MSNSSGVNSNDGDDDDDSFDYYYDDWAFPLVVLELNDNSFTGKLPPALLSQAAAKDVQIINVENLPLLTPISSDDSLTWMGLGPLLRTFKTFSCQNYLVGILALRADPSYFNFFGCDCAKGYFGSPQLDCIVCDKDEGQICDGTSMFISKNQAPVVSPNGTYLGLERCSFEQSCQSYLYNFNRSVNEFELCKPGYSNRLCSQCLAPLYFSVELGCRICANIPLGLWVAYGLILLGSVGLYIFEPIITTKIWKNFGFFLFFALVMTMVVLLVVFSFLPHLVSWHLDALLILIMTLMDELFDGASWITRKGKAHVTTTSLSKTLLFYIQATVILNIEFWNGTSLQSAIVFGSQF